jgi:hypothetical protein
LENAPFAAVRAHRVHVLCCTPLRALCTLPASTSLNLFIELPQTPSARVHEGRRTHSRVSASMVPSSVGSGPVRSLSYRNLHSHHIATLSPQPGNGARVQARWVRVAHVRVFQRVHGAQLCRQRPRPTVGEYIPVHQHRAALSSQPGDGARQTWWVRAAHVQAGQRVHGAQLCRQCARETVVE